MEENKIINFVKKFFENLKAKVYWDNHILVIQNVPESFEKSYGKKSPYHLVFKEEDKINAREDVELVSPGKGILNYITRHLESSGGNTTILKMNFNVEPKNIIEEKIKLGNQRITSIKQTFKNSFFYRFTFQTTFKYLNQKDQLLNELYVHNHEIVNGTLEGYPVSEGKKEDVSTKDIEKNYELAKIKISSLIKEKTKEIGKELNTKLDKETKRVQEHYKNQRNEITKKLFDETGRLATLKNQKTNSEIEKKELIKKIQRVDSLIEKIKQENDFYAIKQEEEFAINDLRQKHSLNIENKLINTTIIYYPIYTFNLIFEGDLKKHLSLIYNPLTESFDNLNCSKCKKLLKVIEVCSEGHVSCSACLKHCENCKKDYCENCLKASCNYCQKRLCNKCITKCSLCGKIFCKEHIHKDNITHQVGCIKCFKRCSKCKEYSNPRAFKKIKISNNNSSDVCQKCYTKEIANKIKEDLGKRR